LQEIDFINTRFYAPSDIDKNLTENFGDWQTPDPHFISHLQCPTTVDVGGEVYMMVCRLEMVRSIVEGKKIKVDRIAHILRENAHSEQSMESALIDRLANQYGSQSSLAADKGPSKSSQSLVQFMQAMKAGKLDARDQLNSLESSGG
jgi:hypothetical protein